MIQLKCIEWQRILQAAGSMHSIDENLLNKTALNPHMLMDFTATLFNLAKSPKVPTKEQI